MLTARGSAFSGRHLLVLVVGVAVAVLSYAAYEARVLNRLELSSVDSRFSIRGKQEPPRNLVIVQIDDASIEKLGHWPFSRAFHARAIRRMSRDDPLAIAYD